MKGKILLSVMATLLTFGISACSRDVGPIPAEQTDESTKENSSQTESDIDDEEEGIMIWAPSEELEVIDKVISEYNSTIDWRADPDGLIKYRFRAMDEEKAANDFVKDPLSMNYPSLIAINDADLRDMQERYQCVDPLPRKTAIAIGKDNAERSVSSAEIDGTMYGYPLSSDDGYFLYYNSEYFTAEQAGSMESLLATAKAKGKKVLFDLDNGYYSASIFLSPQVFGIEKGIGWHYNDENEVVYDLEWASDKGAQVAMDFSNLIVPYVRDGTLIEGDNTAISTYSASGELQAVVSDAAMYAVLTNNWGEDKVVGAKLPTFDCVLPGEENPTSCQLASFISSKLYVVNNYASVEEKVSAHKIAELLTGEFAQLERFKKRSLKPSNLKACQDEGYLAERTPSIEGLEAQEPYGAIQSQVVESLYWTPGENVGRALMQGYFDSNSPLITRDEWKAALEVAVETLVDPSKRVY